MVTCAICKKPTAPNEKPATVIAATRHKVYPERYTEPKYPGGPRDLIDKGGTGTEIARTILVHAGACEVTARRRLEGGPPLSIGLDSPRVKEV